MPIATREMCVHTWTWLTCMVWWVCDGRRRNTWNLLSPDRMDIGATSEQTPRARARTHATSWCRACRRRIWWIHGHRHRSRCCVRTAWIRLLRRPGNRLTCRVCPVAGEPPLLSCVQTCAIPVVHLPSARGGGDDDRGLGSSSFFSAPTCALATYLLYVTRGRERTNGWHACLLAAS